MQNKRSFFERLTGAVKLEDVPVEVQEAPRPSIFEEEEEEGQLTVDVYSTPSEIVIKTMVAGVKPEDLDVSITRDSVTIRGKREEDRTIADDEYYRRNRCRRSRSYREVRYAHPEIAQTRQEQRDQTQGQR
jgi:HSP20 family molecular chaperone IbpA